MSNTSALVSRHSWAVWRSNKEDCTSWTAFTSKTLKRKCQNHPVRAAGAAVSPRKQGSRGLVCGGSDRCVSWRVSHVMHLEPMCCHWWRDNLASEWNKKKKKCFPTLTALLNMWAYLPATDNKQSIFTQPTKIRLWRKAVDNQWILIKQTTATLRLLQMRHSWSAGCCGVIHDKLESHSSPIRQSSFRNPGVSPIINIDVDTQILPVTGADSSCCGWTESGPHVHTWHTPIIRDRCLARAHAH